MKTCNTCANLIEWCKNVWICKVRKNTVDAKKIDKPANCDNWEKR